MTKIDLVTGFLGSGKTTFLKRYIRYLISQGERVCILEFDYGAINVDMMLLQEFDSLCDIEMVAGGCDYDCHLRRFKTKLIAMGMRKYDRVIIEPSGIFDTDEFFDTLYEDPLDQWYEIGSVISIVDSGIKDLSPESEYILISQLSSSGYIVLSKTQNHSEEEVDHAIEYIDEVMKRYKVVLHKDRILRKDFKDFDEKDYQTFMTCGYESQPHVKMDVIESNSYDSIYFMDEHHNLKELTEKAEILFHDESYGHILRIKGFSKEEDSWYEFNLTRSETSKSPLKEGQDVIIVIGEHLNEDKIKNLISFNIK